jgi:hypothetical protein
MNIIMTSGALVAVIRWLAFATEHSSNLYRSLVLDKLAIMTAHVSSVLQIMMIASTSYRYDACSSAVNIVHSSHYLVV